MQEYMYCVHVAGLISWIYNDFVTALGRGKYTDYGVVVLYNDTVTREYHERLGVALGPVTFGASNASLFYDFEKKELLENYTSEFPLEALLKYREAITIYPWLLNGYGELPDAVPEELSGTVGDFLNKHGAGDAAELLGRYNQKIGHVSDQTVLYMGKPMNVEVIDLILSGGHVANAKGDNSEIYKRAGEMIGEGVLLNSQIIGMDRSGSGVKVLIRTPGGAKLIEARKLVVAIPPKTGNLKGFDLSSQEKKVFERLRNTGYYIGLLQNSGLPAGLDITNIGRDTKHNLPVIPGPYGYSPSKVQGLFDVKYGSVKSLSDKGVQTKILENLKDLRDDGVIPGSTVSKPEFARFSSHNPFTLTVTSSDIRGGFYKRMYALQGQRNTFYTGAAWEAQDSSLLWRFTKNNVIPLILQ